MKIYLNPVTATYTVVAAFLSSIVLLVAGIILAVHGHSTAASACWVSSFILFFASHLVD